jgi:ABC-2 type transport system permease protein
MSATITDPPRPMPLPKPVPSARAVQASVPLRDALTQTMILAWRALIKTLRNPEQLVDVTAIPVLFTLMFGFMFAGAISGSQANYLPILIPGIIAQTTLTACVAAGVQLREDMDKGVFDRFRSLPIARVAPLAGPMTADLARYAIAAVVTLLVGVLMGYRPGGGVPGVALAVVLAVITGWSLAWIFMLVGTVARTAGAVQGMSMMIMFPLAFLSNAFVPVDTLPGWLRTVTTINPVSHVVSAMRDLMNHGTVTGNVGWALVGCAAVVAIFVPLAARSYARRL